MSLSITNAVQLSALSSPPPPTDGPFALHLGGSVAPLSTSSRLPQLQQTNLISCSAASQMAPGSWTKDGDALMALIAGWLEWAKVQLSVQTGHTSLPPTSLFKHYENRKIQMIEHVFKTKSEFSKILLLVLFFSFMLGSQSFIVFTRSKDPISIKWGDRDFIFLWFWILWSDLF